MFGTNRPQRDPKEARKSDRTLASDEGSGGDRANKSQKRSSRNPLGGCGTVIIIIIVFLYYVFSDLSGGDWKGNSYDFGITDSKELLTGQGPDYKWLIGRITPAVKKPYTILVFMNGSNLETDYALASADISEMLAADIDESKANVLVLTGGAEAWRSGIDRDLAIYKAGQTTLERIASMGGGTIADKGLVSSFIDMAQKAYPADRYGFIFWDHGGGTLYGYGSDQLHSGAGLSIADMRDAFRQSALKNKGFEFIGFDCCLMSTIEVANFMSPFAKYLVASEETEPGTGWDYSFLSSITKNPSISGAAVGKNIVDLFIASNEDGTTEATLSVIDLSKAGEMQESFENFANEARSSIAKGNYSKISKARRNSRSFGYVADGSSFDLVDIGSMAENLKAEYPALAQNVLNSLNRCVSYNKTTSTVKGAYGLSTYIPYLSKDDASRNVRIYQRLGVFPNFSQFLQSFVEKLSGARVARSSIERSVPLLGSSGELTIKLDEDQLEDVNKISFVIWKQIEEGSDYFIKLGTSSDVKVALDGTIETVFNGYWATLGGHEACYFEISNDNGEYRYSVPAMLNDNEVSIIVAINKKNPDGIVLGALPINTEAVAAKQMIPIASGDRIKLTFEAQLFLKPGDSANGRPTVKSYEGNTFTVGSEGLKNEVIEVGNELYMYGFCVEDIYNNIYNTDRIELRF